MSNTEQRLPVDEVSQRDDVREAIERIQNAREDLARLISEVAEEMEYEQDEWSNLQNMINEEVDGLDIRDYTTYKS